MAATKVPPRSAASELAGLLDSPEIAELVRELEATRWTGRPGYPIRCMVGMALAKSMYAISTWTRTARLVAEHDALQAALGCEGAAPSEWACYRFAAKLRAYKPLLDTCIAAVLDRLHDANPGMGESIAIDASDLPAYANGQRYVSKGGRERERFSDPDASWGHRSAVSTRKGGGFYGFKVHAAVCARTDLPVAWQVETAASHESNYAESLLDAARARGFALDTATLDLGADRRHDRERDGGIDARDRHEPRDLGSAQPDLPELSVDQAHLLAGEVELAHERLDGLALVGGQLLL